MGDKSKRDDGERGRVCACARDAGQCGNNREQQPGSVELALAEGVAFQSNILFTPRYRSS